LKHLKDILEKHRPEIIAIGGFKPNTKQNLLPIIQNEILQNLDLPATKVYIVEDEAARIFMNSKSSLKEFPEYHMLMRYCISLGRICQEPTCEYSNLVNSDDDIKNVRLDPLQSLVFFFNFSFQKMFY
jgi:transcription elongation factor SPT6